MTSQWSDGCRTLCARRRGESIFEIHYYLVNILMVDIEGYFSEKDYQCEMEFLGTLVTNLLTQVTGPGVSGLDLVCFLLDLL